MSRFLRVWQSFFPVSVYPALSEDPRRDSICCQQVIWFVRCSHSAVDPRFQFVFWLVVSNFVEKGVAVFVVTAFFLLGGIRGVGFSRVILRLAVRSWSSPSAISSTLASCAAAERLPEFLFVCMIIPIIRCVVWSFFFVSSVIVHVPGAWRSDGVTVESEKFESVSRWVCW